VWLFPEDLDRLPDICVKTGVPTKQRVAFQALDQPAWVGLIWLFGGFLAFLIARSYTTQRLTVALPLSEDALNGRRRRQQDCMAVVAAGVAMVIVALAVKSALLAPLGVVFAGGGIVMAMIVGIITGVRVRYQASDQAVIVTHCHAAFADAIAALP
jgi:hypothetical protein